jgi:hypothetical protein
VPEKVNEPPVAVPETLNVPPEPNTAPAGLYRKPDVLVPVVKLTVPALAPSLMPNADKPLTLVRVEAKLRVVLEPFEVNVPSRFRNVAVFPSVMVFAIAASGTNARMVARARTCTFMKYASARVVGEANPSPQTADPSPKSRPALIL